MFRVFQSARLDKHEDLASEMRDLTELHCMGSEFHAVKGRLPATPTSLKSRLHGLENFRINSWSVGSLDNCFSFN